VDEVIAILELVEESWLVVVSFVLVLTDYMSEKWMSQLAVAAVARHCTIEASGGTAIGVDPVLLRLVLGQNSPRMVG
jgi:hypothetical protein